jgi:hypothetical protein
MGYPAIDIAKLSIYTSKHVDKSKLVDSRIWLIAGEGNPRSYYLRATFRIGNFGPSENPDFKHRVTGTDGQLLDPMPNLTNESWFPAFKKTQGNFAFGFNAINDTAAIAGLKSILKARGSL